MIATSKVIIMYTTDDLQITYKELYKHVHCHLHTEETTQKEENETN